MDLKINDFNCFTIKSSIFEFQYNKYICRKRENSCITELIRNPHPAVFREGYHMTGNVPII